MKDYFARDIEKFFPRTFNEQMTWIGEEVERIIKNNGKFHSKEKILKEGKMAYVAELNSKPMHYLLVQGDENSYDDMVGIGIYQTIGKLREAYYSVLEEMEKEQKELIEEYGADDCGVQYAIRHEKVKIYAFDENSEKWTWDIVPEQIFGKENGKIE